MEFRWLAKTFPPPTSTVAVSGATACPLTVTRAESLRVPPWITTYEVPFPAARAVICGPVVASSVSVAVVREVQVIGSAVATESSTVPRKICVPSGVTMVADGGENVKVEAKRRTVIAR